MDRHGVAWRSGILAYIPNPHPPMQTAINKVVMAFFIFFDSTLRFTVKSEPQRGLLLYLWKRLLAVFLCLVHGHDERPELVECQGTINSAMIH